jgi:hypothetical protein
MDQTVLIKIARTMIAQAAQKVAAVHEGVTINGCRQSAISARTYRPEGYTPDYSFTLIAIANDFATPPEPDDTVTVNSITYKVNGQAEFDPAGVLVRVDLRLAAGARA